MRKAVLVGGGGVQTVVTDKSFSTECHNCLAGG